MSRGVGYGGGRSSLGYLFGSGEQPPAGNNPPPSPSKLVPPYGTHIEEENQPTANTLVDQKQDNSNSNHQRAQGQNSGSFVSVSNRSVMELYALILQIKVDLHYDMVTFSLGKYIRIAQQPK